MLQYCNEFNFLVCLHDLLFQVTVEPRYKEVGYNKTLL